MLNIPAPYEFSKLESRSISAENPTGAKGAGNKVKTKQCISIEPWSSVELCNIEGNGMIRHIWLPLSNRTPEMMRSCMIRIFWDGLTYPSVEAPFGDFFGVLHGRTAHYSSPYLSTPEGKGFNCFFPMPFKKGCRIVFVNDSPIHETHLYYQISYTLGDTITDNMGRFHAHFRRDTPPIGEDFVMLETDSGPGIYVGSLIGALPLTEGSWREGEIRWFMDGDQAGPTICGTGWSDYFLSAWGLGLFESNYSGSNYQVIHPETKERYFCSCYRFHLLDPIYFQTDLKVTYEQRGMKKGVPGFHPRSDDWSSVVYWYQAPTGKPLPPMPAREDRIKGIEILDWEPAALERRIHKIDTYDDVVERY